MSFFSCPCCGKASYLFGEVAPEKITSDIGLNLLGEVPLLVQEGKGNIADFFLHSQISGITEKIIKQLF